MEIIPSSQSSVLDTLCIPVGEEYHYLKTRAINSMARTYANAQAIIILDHELQQLKYRDMSVSQIMGLLASSAWMSWCWTFQEGAMAKQWLIQFEDGIWSPDPVRQDYGSNYHILSELREFFKGVPRQNAIEGQRKFGHPFFLARIYLI
jgi:hypothetical protein